MSAATVSNIQTLLSLILFFTIAKWYILPRLYKVDLHAALVPLLLFSAFRYLGLSFLVPTVSDGLSTTIFATQAAYGDFSVSLLALAAVFANRARWSVGLLLAWAYAVLGSLDFIYAGYLASQSDLPSNAGSLWLTLNLLGPAWMITLVFTFVVLIRHPQKAEQSSELATAL